MKTQNKEFYTDNPHYDILEGHLTPEEVLENPEDIKKVQEALDVVLEYLSLVNGIAQEF